MHQKTNVLRGLLINGLTRQQFIDFIKANDKSYAKTNLNNHSVTALVLIKTNIEINIANSKGTK